MLSVLCVYLVNVCLIFSILYMLYRSLMARQEHGSGLDKGRPRKHGLPPHTRAPPTNSTTLVSTTTPSFAPLGHSPHTEEFVMIPNLGYVESGPQPLFLP